MAKKKKENIDQGASDKKTKASEVKNKKIKPVELTAPGKIGIGMPVDEETLKKMKEEAEKL